VFIVVLLSHGHLSELLDVTTQN